MQRLFETLSTPPPRIPAEQAADLLRRQVIHNDMNPGNLLVHGRDPNRLAGVIDFGDMVYSQLVNDLRNRGLLTNTIGPDANVLKLRCPMVFSRKDADYALGVIGDSLAATAG